jgi:hypothetical protein
VLAERLRPLLEAPHRGRPEAGVIDSRSSGSETGACTKMQ